MENIFVVKQFASITDVADLEDIAEGDLLAIADGKVVVNPATLSSALADKKEVQFFTRTKDGKIKNSVSIPRRGCSMIVQLPAADSPLERVIGGGTLLTRLDIPAEGEAYIAVRNSSYNHAINTQKISVSLNKRASETPLQFVTNLVAKLNAAMAMTNVPFATFTLVNANVSGTECLGIAVVATSVEVDLSVQLDGILEGANNAVTSDVVVGVGKGIDVARMELDFSRNLGNKQFEKLGDLWYKQYANADINTLYTMVTLSWTGVANQGATTKANVANNVIMFAFSIDFDVADDSEVRAFFNLIIGLAYESQGADGGTDTLQGSDIDATT